MGVKVVHLTEVTHSHESGWHAVQMDGLNVGRIGANVAARLGMEPPWKGVLMAVEHPDPLKVERKGVRRGAAVAIRDDQDPGHTQAHPMWLDGNYVGHVRVPGGDYQLIPAHPDPDPPKVERKECRQVVRYFSPPTEDPLCEACGKPLALSQEECNACGALLRGRITWAEFTAQRDC